MKTAKKLTLSLPALALGLGLLAALPHAAQAQLFLNPGYNGPTPDKADFQAGNQAALRLLNDDKPAIGRYETWSNPASGNKGKLTIEGISTVNNLPCRELESTIEYGKKGAAPRSFTMNVCKTTDGSWKTL